jgi:hypothetical protein
MENLVEYIKEHYEQDPVTGNFLCKKVPVTSKNGKLAEGQVAGTANKDGYRRITIKRKSYLVHRICWLLYYGKWPAKQLDHIDGNKQNNRIDNLREADGKQNSQNTLGKKSNKTTSRYKGVYWNKTNKTWIAAIQGKYLGSFPDERSATLAYNRVAADLFKQFARLNNVI